MSYTKQTWIDNSLGAPLSAARLNHIEDGIAAVDGSIATATTVANRNIADKIVYVATTGSDSNNGLAIGTPFLTIGAAFTALGTGTGTVEVAGGSYSFGGTINRYTGQRIQGAGMKVTILIYTGTGTAITSAVSGTRIYGCDVGDFTLTSSTGAVGIDMDSVSNADCRNVTVTGFSAKEWYLHSTVGGGDVYNTFTGCLGFGKGPLTASIGWDVNAAGSNTNNWFSCGARNCGIGLNVMDSNQNVWVGGTFEVNGIGFMVDASSSSLSDLNTVRNARFEGNTQNWLVNSAFVRETIIDQPAEVTALASGVDNGIRSHITAPRSGSKTTSTATANANGSWRFDRSVGGGSELPALVVVDSATASGTPVTLQLQTERSTGYALRATRGGANYFDVDAAGNMRQPQGSYFELTERTDPSAPATNNARLYAKDNGAGATELVVRFPTGSVQALAIEGGAPTLIVAPDIQYFTATGANTWTKPTGALVVEVQLIGGGGGGGSGRRGVAGSIRCGGGSAGGGFVIGRQFDAGDLSSTVTVTVGAGGAGGAAVTANDTSGNNGSAGARTTFGTYLAGGFGNPGLGGTAAAGTGGAGPFGAAATNGAGASASTTGGVGSTAANGLLSAPGGGAGGGITSADSPSAGGNGGTPHFGNIVGVTGLGGVVDTTTPTSGTATTIKGSAGPGPGGGAASITTAAQAGGNAVNFGGGGGGGGASLNGNNSGAGGNGGNGSALIITYFQ